MTPRHIASAPRIAIVFSLVTLTSTLFAQTLGGYSIQDFLVSAIHPNGCSADYVTGPPDTSTWVNLAYWSAMSGTFGSAWSDRNGADLLLETSYHADNYTIELVLSNGSNSTAYTVQEADWSEIAGIPWQYAFPDCATGTLADGQYIVPLDFGTHFGLQPTDEVVGINLTFLPTDGAPDLAGVYIIGDPPCDVDLGEDMTLCEGDSLSLDATTANATYMWHDNSTNPTFTVTETGTYWVEVMVGNCTSIDSIVVDFTSNPTIDLGNDTSICEGLSMILNPEVSDAAYVWQDNSTNSTFTVTQSGTYSVTVTVDNCSTSDSIIINTTPYPEVNLGNDTSICAGETLLVDATWPGATYLWQDDSTDPTLSISQEGTYWVEVTADLCVSSDSIMVNITPTPAIHIGNDTSICQGTILILDIGFENATYQWQDNSTERTFTVTNPGTYWAEVTNSCGNARDSIRVMQHESTEVNLGNDTIICLGTTITLDAGDMHREHVWQDNSTNQTLNVSQTGTYWVSSTDQCQRTSTDTISIEFENCNCSLYVPNAFSPNGDQVNDSFKPFTNCTPAEYNLKIFDRWGALVFESNDRDRGWDGTFKNKISNAGTYAYVISYSFRSSAESKTIISGDINLIR